ncbi:MAG: hypothetical protein IKB79_01120 [Oscillospiraceae bacterium]|nr:hypothetical protein [Oscillospiraceae bacterium]
MFGYVRPVREELKCKDFDLYRATYCGLCRTMRKRCGWLAPMVLNFDFTFLAVLLAPAQGEKMTTCHRCQVPPFLRRCMCETSAGLELAADESVILAYWQIRDRVRDDTFLRGLPARGFSVLLRPCYKRCARRQPEFDRKVKEQLGILHRLEAENCTSIDRAADAFAVLLQAAAPETGEQNRDRAMEQLLYHLGRWIYLADARDDLEDDRAKGCYNPISLRYGQQACDEPLALTMEHSLSLMRGACALLELGRQEELVNNVLCLGLPLVQRSIFNGSWRQMKKQKIWRNKL